MGSVGNYFKKFMQGKMQEKTICANKKVKKKNYIKFAGVYKNNSLYSKYSWGLTSSPAILLINKDI